MRPRRTICAALAIVTVMIAARPDVVAAHAYLIRAAPQPGAVLASAPRGIRLWFSEPIDLPPTPLELYAPNGRRIRATRIHVAPDDATEMVGSVHLPDRGTYTLRWKVISADTHPVRGEFTFSIGAPSPVVAPINAAPEWFRLLGLSAQAAARLLDYLSLALLTGPLVLWSTVLAPAVWRRAPAATVPTWQGVRRLFGWGIGAIATGSVLTLLAQLMSVSDQPQDALTLDALAAVMGGRLGLLIAVRLLVALVLYVAGAIMSYLGPGRLLAPRRTALRAPHATLRIVWACDILLVVTVSLSSHASVTEPVLLSLLVDTVHLSAMALWIGGLLTFAVAASDGLRRVGTSERQAVLTDALPHFSTLALRCVVALVATGVYSTVRNLNGPLDVLSTGYGRALGLKLLLSSAVVPFASFNLLAIRPALLSAPGHGRHLVDLWPVARTFIRAEAVLAAGVLVVVGVLAALPPARQSGSGVSSGVVALSITRAHHDGRTAVHAKAAAAIKRPGPGHTWDASPARRCAGTSTTPARRATISPTCPRASARLRRIPHLIHRSHGPRRTSGGLGYIHEYPQRDSNP